MVRVAFSLQAKREALRQMAPHYRRASAVQKKELLDAFTRTTGYHRKYAMWLPNHAEEVHRPLCDLVGCVRTQEKVR